MKLNTDLCNRVELYTFHKELFQEFSPFYERTFVRYAKQYAFPFSQVALGIDEKEWRPTANVRRVDDGRYSITIARGLFERLLYLVTLLTRIPVDISTPPVMSCDFAWKDPEASLYDDCDSSDLVFLSDNIAPLLKAYPDETSYQNDFEAQWGQSWPKHSILNRTAAIPFFWVVDFIVYHEMSHILLRHFDKLKSSFPLGIISETDLGPHEQVLQRHLIEGHADFHCVHMLASNLPKFVEAHGGKEIDALMKENMFILSFVLLLLFSFWGKKRKSIRFYENLPHPHPDYRRLLFWELCDLFLAITSRTKRNS